MKRKFRRIYRAGWVAGVENILQTEEERCPYPFWNYTKRYVWLSGYDAGMLNAILRRERNMQVPYYEASGLYKSKSSFFINCFLFLLLSFLVASVSTTLGAGVAMLLIS